MLIEVVSHCYAVEYPHYAQALCYQMSSLVLENPRNCSVGLCLVCDVDDENTEEILWWFITRRYANVNIRFYYLPPEELGRRAIGRNLAALSTEADLVWFADCDQAFCDGIFDRLAFLNWPEDAVMVYPREIMISRDHATGDRAMAAANRETLIEVDKSEFISKRYRKAIGGVQIVRGDFARQHGYLRDDPKWQKPTDGRFVSCRCDVAFRKFCQQHGRIVGVNLPGVYRIRHTQAAHGRKPKL